MKIEEVLPMGMMGAASQFTTQGAGSLALAYSKSPILMNREVAGMDSMT
jgi:hypothetical protein